MFSESVLGKSQGLRPWGKGSATKCLFQPQTLWWLQEEYRVEEEDSLENEKQTNKQKQHPPPNKQTKEPNQTKKPLEAYLEHKDGHIFMLSSWD